MALMREKNWLVTLSSAEKDYGVWKSLEGGDETSEATVEYPGGMAPGIAVPGGNDTIEAITIVRQFDQQRDMMDAFGRLREDRRRGTQVTVAQQALDYAKQPFGVPIVDTGVITSVQRPKADAASDAISTLTVIIQPNGR